MDFYFDFEVWCDMCANNSGSTSLNTETTKNAIRTVTFFLKGYHKKIPPDVTLTFCLTKPVDKGVKTRWHSPIDNRPSTYKVREVKL